MKTKILYVLTSTEKDIYLEQAYVSMASAKHHMPDCHIVLLVDDQSAKTLEGKRKTEIQFVDELVVVDVDHSYSRQECSRILKTSAREHVKGDFLFVDSDTIFVKPIYEVDDLKFDMAACPDSHSDIPHNPYRDSCLIGHGHLLNWSIDNEKVYFNSGIIFVRDCAKTHEFYQLWNKNWKKYHHLTGGMDQPSFARTNYELGHPVQVLDDTWNVELKHGMKFLKDARIVHYLTTNPSVNGIQLFLMNSKEKLMEVKSGIIPNDIQQLFDDPFKGLSTPTLCLAYGDMMTYYHLTLDVYPEYMRMKSSKLVMAAWRFYLYVARVTWPIRRRFHNLV
ncbi:putative nucleotide-diphospho-sugar transferase [Prevotella sp. AGR2160]|uniref:putative nucleotide-diphospho-sugar transferase n=1 Tax=Prevotella sp. AGR2160 TaxID=1280674 RepID=UPI000426EBA4|nr:putative nucleotide-diphospho-sugar transferase [Prevotella sp. AGR2160]